MVCAVCSAPSLSTPAQSEPPPPSDSANQLQRMESSLHLEDSLKRGQLAIEGWGSFVDETINDLGGFDAFDYLVIDEAQNLSNDVFLRLQGALLKGGIEDGNWTMFGDFKNQNLVTNHDNTESMVRLKETVRPASGALGINCRNTQEIADEVARMVRIESPTMTGVHGPLVQFKSFDTQEELAGILNEIVRDWKEVGFQYNTNSL